MAYCTGRCMCHPVMNFAFEAEDVSAMVQRIPKGKVAFYGGDAQIAPGLHAHHFFTNSGSRRDISGIVRRQTGTRERENGQFVQRSAAWGR